MKAKVYNQEGKEARDISLPKEIFELSPNDDLVHQVVVGMQANARTPIAHAKDRSEVRGGGAKPWKQKGTGRARHGSNRSPIWSGGGVTHGPTKEKDYSKKINKKMRKKALLTVLSQKMKEGQILFLDKISVKEVKTKEAKDILNKLGKIKGFEEVSTRKNNAALIVLEDNGEVKRSFNNLGNVFIGNESSMNPVNVLKYKYLIIVDPEKMIEKINK